MRVRREARFLLQLLGKHGETLRTLRETIAVPRSLENALRKYAQTFPADTWVLDAIQFRKEVAEEFDSLVKEPKYAELVAAAEAEDPLRAEAQSPVVPMLYELVVPWEAMAERLAGARHIRA